ncbi:MAG: hypothetical protein AB7N90_09470, partial [Vicinamibacterales bacterium]
MLRVGPSRAAARALLLLALACLLPASRAHAQDVPAFGLAPKASPALANGRIVFAEGTVDRTGMRFLLPELNILQPIGLAVATANDDDRVRVVLGRDRWDETIREATTTSGAAGFALHTQGDIRVTLATDGEPVHFLLAAWVGADVTPPAPPVLETRAAGTGGWTGWLVAAGVLAALAAAALVLMRRRTDGAAAAAVLAAVLLSGAAVAAQGGGTTVLG